MSPPAPHLRLVPSDAFARASVLTLGRSGAFARHGLARPQRDMRKPLGQVLLDMKAVDPGNLLRAIRLRDGRDARLGDILLSHGWVGEADLVAALAAQWAAKSLDLLKDRPDARLFDQLGAEFCLENAVLPWRRIGGATVIATARPEDFGRLRAALAARFGAVVMALAPERDIHAALLGMRQTALIRKAECRVPASESCRSLSPLGGSIMAIAALALVLVGLATVPTLVFSVLAGWAVLTLVAFSALKAFAFAAVLRQRPGPAPPLPDRLPVVSVMVPLLQEDDIVPRLVRRIGRIHYPKELLDILLIVEQDDHATLAALARRPLPRWMRIVTVPAGPIRTKPRALNFALDFCRGSIVGIWDAEDAPDPEQIRAVVGNFAAAPPEVACLQGVLDFYNPRHNWITRCFAVEYAGWFRAMLPGLARLGLVVPLGGTTLFFRRSVLEELGGWDAHNVTEDADLGIRLARHGYRTELIDTVTREEPNSRPVAWIRQRARWQKGYAITWASHMRDPARLWRDLGPRRFLGVQILFLGTLSQSLFAPVLWSFWLLAFGLAHPLAGLLPTGVLATLGGLFIASEALNIAVGLWATRGPEHRHLMKWVPTLHAYFPLASLSAYRALSECITRPFHWDKTTHGIVAGQSAASDVLPVLVLSDPVHIPDEAAAPASPPAFTAPPLQPRPGRLHLALAGPWPEEVPDLRPFGRPRLTVIEGGQGAGGRAPYVLGSTIAGASGHPGIEFQPSFEGF